MRVIVCGGRDFNDRDYLFAVLDEFHDVWSITTVIHGGARGADALGAEWAQERGLKVRVVRADWARYGKSAGPIRNGVMLCLNPDAVIAFPGGAGTRNMVTQARSEDVAVLDVGGDDGTS